MEGYGLAPITYFFRSPSLRGSLETFTEKAISTREASSGTRGAGESMKAE